MFFLLPSCFAKLEEHKRNISKSSVGTARMSRSHSFQLDLSPHQHTLVKYTRVFSLPAFGGFHLDFSLACCCQNAPVLLRETLSHPCGVGLWGLGKHLVKDLQDLGQRPLMYSQRKATGTIQKPALWLIFPQGIVRLCHCDLEENPRKVRQSWVRSSWGLDLCARGRLPNFTDSPQASEVPRPPSCSLGKFEASENKLPHPLWA